MKKYKIPSKTKIGHIHLTVSDLERSLKFYRDLLGFEVTQNMPSVVFLSAGGYHHHIGLNIWAKKGARKPEEGQIGLYHFAILYPSKKELARALKNLIDADYRIDGASDHGVSQAIYLKDPDGNGIELYADKNKKDWPKDNNGEIDMDTKILDIDDLLKEVI